MDERVKTLLEGRRERLRRAAGRPLERQTGDPTPLPERDREHLFEDARDLYENELAWEDITGEERLDDGPLVQLAFPGFLAYVRGLLLDETMPDSLAPASPRPEVVDDILAFLARRALELEERTNSGADDSEDRARASVALAMTDRLIDLVMFELYGITEAEVEALES